MATRESDAGIPLTDLYRADYSNVKFTKVLSNIVVGQGNGIASFQEVPALEGLYFANIYEEQYLEIQAQLVNTRAGSNTDIRHFIMTQVSFDYGKTWSRVQPPNIDSTGQVYSCRDESCFLNLHLKDSEGTPCLYGVESAPGILLAVGSVGNFLSQIDSEVSTFISEDGGVKWRELVSTKMNTYEIADQGGLIVMADYNSPTSTFHFSSDRGRTWTVHSLFSPVSHPKADSKQILMTNVVTEPSNLSHRVILLGKGINEEKGFVFGVDFSSLHSRLCVGEDQATAPHSDYTKFVPHTYASDKCKHTSSRFQWPDRLLYQKEGQCQVHCSR